MSTPVVRWRFLSWKITILPSRVRITSVSISARLWRDKVLFHPSMVFSSPLPVAPRWATGGMVEHAERSWP
ncbi:MAG: hypothetical protein WKF83_05810 [Nocardioidaceae bacterium]